MIRRRVILLELVASLSGELAIEQSAILQWYDHDDPAAQSCRPPTATGKMLWQFSLPGALGFRVLVQDGMVFTDGESSSHQHTLTALRASDGQVLWQDAPSPPLQLPELLGTGPGVVYIRHAVGNSPGLPRV